MVNQHTLLKVPRYPALLYDCMTSCWDQDPRIRPSATQLLNALHVTKLQLIDSFVLNEYKITDVQCCCKVFNEENGKEHLWLAVNGQSVGSSILVIEFQEQGNKIVPQITKVRHTLANHLYNQLAIYNCLFVSYSLSLLKKRF